MTPFRSIRWRLQFWHGLLLALVLGGFGLTAFQFERAAVLHAADDELQRRVARLAEALRPAAPRGRAAEPADDGAAPGNARPDDSRPDESPGAPPPDEAPFPSGDFRPGPSPRMGPGAGPELGAEPRADLDAGPDDQDRPPPPRPRRRARPLALRLSAEDQAVFSGSSEGGLYYVAWVRNGVPVTRSTGAPEGVPQPNDPGAAASGGIRGPRLRSRGVWREAWLPLKPGDFVLVGRSLAADQASLHRLAWLLGAVGAAIFCVAWAGGAWLAARALRPIADISAAAAKIASGDLGRRIATPDSESELGQLAQVLNSTFERLDKAFALQARFTADAAHELRTPVTVILAHAQNGLAEECLADGHREALEACQRAAQRMRNLVEALLELARLDAGRQPMRRGAFDLAERAGEAVSLLQGLAEERGIPVAATLAATPCYGDPGQIDQVLTNLLANAIHHNRPGGGVTVSTRPAEDGGATLVVADTGPGIPAEHRPHVFERFYRADGARGGGTGRTGLGLAISKAIVEAHGGTIGVVSEPGHGAVFTVRFPPQKIGG